MKSVHVPEANVIMLMKFWTKPVWSHVLDASSCSKATKTTDGADGPRGSRRA